MAVSSHSTKRNDRDSRVHLWPESTIFISNNTIEDQVCAVGRERLRDPDHLHALYQETNKEFFGGQLRDVEVKSHDLSDYKAEGITYQGTEDRFVIVLDPKWNTSEDEAVDTMRHEACHVATWDVMDPNDVHGPPFQKCMKRFTEKE